MRAALQDRLDSSRVATISRTASLPAPVGGWNTRDSLVTMGDKYAITLENFFPRQGQCELRGGSVDFATGMTGDVKTIIHYDPPAAADKLLGVTNAGFYDITAGGAVGGVAKALTEGYVNQVFLTNSAGTTFLWAANGVDKVVLFDGTTWTSLDGVSSPAITGVTTTNLVFPWLFKHRIWCIEKGTMNAWYLPIDSIAGAASQFNFGNLFKLGGELISGTAWTLDSGNGPDDLLAVVTSAGELAVYSGTDPASSSAFSLVGVWYVGIPLGRRCFTKLGGDVAVLTANGIFLLSKLLASGSVNFLTALTNKIQPTFSALAAGVGVNAKGWEGCVYPSFDAFIMNVPGTGVQIVLNTITGALCSFSGWNALCFESTQNNTLYFGSPGGKVLRAWDGELVADNGSDILTNTQQAYNYFGSATDLKAAQIFRPLLAYDAGVQIGVGISSDYTPGSITSVYPRGSLTGGSLWDVSDWDTSPWLPRLNRYKNWMSAVHVPGYALSLLMQTASNNSKLTWSGTDFVFKTGGVM